jgi:hypothetical protein
MAAGMADVVGISDASSGVSSRMAKFSSGAVGCSGGKTGKEATVGVAGAVDKGGEKDGENGVEEGRRTELLPSTRICQPNQTANARASREAIPAITKKRARKKAPHCNM